MCVHNDEADGDDCRVGTSAGDYPFSAGGQSAASLAFKCVVIHPRGVSGWPLVPFPMHSHVPPMARATVFVSWDDIQKPGGLKKRGCREECAYSGNSVQWGYRGGPAVCGPRSRSGKDLVYCIGFGVCCTPVLRLSPPRCDMLEEAGGEGRPPLFPSVPALRNHPGEGAFRWSESELLRRA